MLSESLSTEEAKAKNRNIAYGKASSFSSYGKHQAYYMKHICILFLSVLSIFSLKAQNPQKASQFLKEGIALHDEGKYEEAIQKYDAALTEEPDNYTALYEKAFSLSSLNRSKEAIEIAKKLIKTCQNESTLQLTYVLYGNTLDQLGKGKEAIKIYDQGIKKFPDHYLLYFNKGISLAQQEKQEEALENFQKAIVLEPNHPGSHNMIGRILLRVNKVPAMLALMRMLVLEPESKRAAQNWQILQEILMPASTDKKEITITMGALKNLSNNKPKEDDFFAAEFILGTMGSEVKVEEKQLTGLEKLNFQLDTFFSMLGSLQDKKTGFYWQYYVPYFAEMQKKSMVTTFMYIIQASNQSKEVQSWLSSHGKEIEDFYAWNKNYTWPALK
ncbi:tetratricopeptide repeat protein [Cytophagaceae bacterium DM2B3-1]|uniref:Tetratricopeptide repeat protein n=1 Tax=Xanthocytophaga flava TaxID=3048013 RepID=A0ABT7CWB1_9BACT|nr:tetratricopeptide repeat protein [Xanthocytophaga flavus]MDJ1472482.1 tetratricopeptide repeat protein [Xanthocytophaga flavus]MDJ1497796.1 tetratricopeptide repeat protein [Xanthocytophaga flavus]